MLGIYDATYIPENVIEAGKAAYVERNRHMIDRADLCVFCYDENYKPPLACGARGRAVCEKRNESRLRICGQEGKGDRQCVWSMIAACLPILRITGTMSRRRGKGCDIIKEKEVL